MGAYLSEPIVEKVSSDEKNEFIQVGASSMQGWRISQEDAHNCILNFDENTSFFAVYDGHGGAEVATYCADNLPQFLKDLKSYKGGDFESALKDAFLGFDATLLKDDVVEILKRLAGEKNPENESDMADDEDEEDLVELCQEGTLPLDQVLEKYKGCAAAGKFPQIHKLKQGEGCGASGSAGGFGGCSSSSSGGAVGSCAGPSGSAMKPMSPFLRGRRNFRCPNIFPKHAPGGSCSSSTSGGSKVEAGSASPSSSPSMPLLTSSASSKKEVTSTATKKKLDSEFDESAVSSSSGKADEAADDKSSGDATCTSATNGTAGLVCNSPDSSSANGKKEAHKIGQIEANPVASIQNGSITESSMSSSHQENVISTNSAAPKVAVSSSTSSATKSESSKENGEISSSPAPSGTAAGPGRGASPVKITSSTSTNESTTNTITAGMAKKQTAAVNKHSMVHDEDDSTSDDDADVDFHAEVDNSSTEDCEPGEEETEDEMEDEETEDDEEEMIEEDEEDNSFCSNMVEEPGKDSGCTAVLALLNGRDLYVANAGDSRCVVCRNGKAVEMSFDHKPEDIEESDRIIKAGGKVTLDGRVNGGLNLSRAIGDHAYKMNADLPPEKQMISALPDIRKLIITPDDEFMILACDGIWNFMSSEEVVEFIRKRLAEKEKMSQICEDLFDHCLAPNTIGDGTGCDNMTAVIIRFKPKILDLPTKIDFDVVAMESIKKPTEETVPSNKRSASAISQSDVADGNTNGDSGNLKKRLKTDDDEADSVAASSDTAAVVASDDDVTMKSISSNSIGEDVPLPSAGIDSSSAPTSEAIATETTTDPSTTEAAAAAT